MKENSIPSPKPNQPTSAIPVAAGVLRRGKRFLAAKRPDGKTGGGFWEFPGGKREAGESMAQALCRELFEEIGIVIRPEAVIPWKELTHEAFGQRVELHFMRVTAFSGDPTPREGQELRWMALDEAETLPFLPVDIGILPELKPFLESEEDSGLWGGIEP